MDEDDCYDVGLALAELYEHHEVATVVIKYDMRQYERFDVTVVRNNGRGSTLHSAKAELLTAVQAVIEELGNG